MLYDRELTNDALDLKVAIIEENDDDDEDDDKGEYKGFCVYGKKICIYGNDGLFTADVVDDWIISGKKQSQAQLLTRN